MHFALNFFHFMFYNFFINEKISFSSNALWVVILTMFLLNLFAYLISSSSRAINEYIFDFHRANSLVIFPLNSYFILPIAFLLTGSKNFVFC